MFRKKRGDSDGGEPRPPGEGVDISAPPLKPFSKRGSHAPTKVPARASFPAEVPRRVLDIPGVPRRVERMRGDSDAKRLIVGRDICLSGQITACDRLVVEGRVEVSLSNARVIEIAPTGHFRGSAEVDEADISGRFEGDLVARERLTVRAGGQVSGSIRYGSIVIESGGEISGDMQTLEAARRSDGIALEAEPPAAGGPPPPRPVDNK